MMWFCEKRYASIFGRNGKNRESSCEVELYETDLQVCHSLHLNQLND